jgi:type IV pilus assembly protein PilQ
MSALVSQPLFAQGANRLEDVRATVLSGNKVELTLRLSDTAPQPLTFTVDNPARIALDLPDTSVAMTSRRIDVKQGALDTVNVAEANGRTRVVLNVDSLVPYETRVQGNSIIVTLESNGRAANASAIPSAAIASQTHSAPISGTRSVNNIDFRRGSDGSGRVIVDLTDAKVPADLSQEGGRIVVNFAKTALPDALMQRLDVTDFATPVSSVDALRVGDGTRLVIAATGDYEQLAYQSENIYTIEIKPVVKLPPELQDKKEYTGERLTLNFQDIETRAVLQLLADTSGQNMVILDTVGGNVTLRLQNVPWDQALDVVMRTKGLDMRQDGNVMMIGPAAEIAAREKEMLAARQEVQQLAPLRSEFLQVNYAKAADLAAVGDEDGGKHRIKTEWRRTIGQRDCQAAAIRAPPRAGAGRCAATGSRALPARRRLPPAAPAP